MRPAVIIGPPGTGKTTAIMSEVSRALTAGVEPDRVAVVTYTRAARREVLERFRAQFGLSEEALPWVRTVHSTAARLLELGNDHYFGPRHLRDFAQQHGYLFSPTSYGHVAAGADPYDWQPTTDDDRLLSLYERMRARRLTPEQAIADADEPPRPPTAFADFLARFRAYKSDRWLIDYADMLDYAVQHDARPLVRLAVVDEVQDLSPSQLACVAHWFGDGPELLVAGDPDQAVFTWSGADPTWLASAADQAERDGRLTVLPQSYRVPTRVRAVAAAIIQRNANRRRWRWAPKPGDPGDVHWTPRGEAIAACLAATEAGRRAFVLYRNRAHMAVDAERLHDLGAAYLVEGSGGVSPLADADLLDAVRAFADWAHGRPASPAALADALRAYVRVDGRLLHRKVKGTPGGPGTREGSIRLLEALGRPAAPADAERLGLSALLAVVQSRGPLVALTRAVCPAARRYLADVLRRHDGQLPANPLVLTTYHGSKGREADVVACVPDMTRTTWEGYQGRHEAAEHRLGYVAVTRARTTLYLCDAEAAGGRAFAWPTPRACGLDFAARATKLCAE